MKEVEHNRKEKKDRWFERNPKKAIAVTIGLMFLITLILFEFCLRYFMGFGTPVLYDSNPLYGYRLLPNQEVSRFQGSIIKINNLGLRANQDWDNRVDNKILFLGDSVPYGGSYISNDELFSNLAIKNIDGYESGNAGINGWGVENIHGFIVYSKFSPARIYITVVPEMDFYRGLTRLQGLPFWNHNPNFAFQELLYFFYYKETLKKYRSWQEYASEKDRNRVIENAVIKLKEVDEFLKSQGYLHLIYISPTREQALNEAEKDKNVLYFLEKYDLNVTYILDQIDLLNFSRIEKENLFYDGVHLTKQGHIIWGEIINSDLVKLVEN